MQLKRKGKKWLAVLLAAGILGSNVVTVTAETVTLRFPEGVMVNTEWETPDGYVEATNQDFEKNKEGFNIYVGSEENVLIPRKIGGVEVTSVQQMFMDSEVKGVATYPDNKIVNMEQMFLRSRSSVLELIYLHTPSVINMSKMFVSSQVSRLDLTAMDTSNVTTMESMFLRSWPWYIDVSSFNTSKVTSMRAMFAESKVWTADLNSFDTTNVTNMGQMFSRSSVKNIDLNNFKTSKVKDMSNMFQDTEVQYLGLHKFDTSNVTDANNMFLRTTADVVYARTVSDETKFSSSKGKPQALRVTIGAPPPRDITKPEIFLVNENVIQAGKVVSLGVLAEDNVGLHKEAYSFDGGVSWQSSNSKMFRENQTVEIIVRDAGWNISEPHQVVITEIGSVVKPPTNPTIPNIPSIPDGGTASDKDGNVMVDEEGSIKDSEGNTIVDKDGNILDKDGGTLVDKDGNILDKDGNIVVDKDGNIVNGSLDKEGNIIDNEGNIVVDKDGNILDRDGSVAVDKDGNILDKDGNVVVDKDGNIKDSQGNTVVDKDGNILDKDGNIIVDKDGNHYLPGLERPTELPVKDSEGNIVIDEAGNILDKEGNIVVDTNNKVVGGSIDENGNVVDSAGNIIIDKDGNILDKDGNILVDKDGNVYIPGINIPSTLPVKDKEGNIVIDVNGNILDQEGNIVVDSNGKVVGGTVNPDGSVSDSNGNVIIDKDGNILDKDGNIIVDKAGNVVDNTVKVDSFVITSDNITLLEGESQEIVYTILPAEAKDKTVTWTSSNDAIAIVSKGKVIALKEGTAIITGTTTDGALTDELVVTVSKVDVPVEKVLESIDVEDPSALIKEYTKGDKYNPKGNLILTYNDNTTEIKRITTGMVTHFDSDLIGDGFVELTFEGKTLTYDIIIKDVAETPVTITTDHDESLWSKTIKLAVSISGSFKEVILPNGAKLFNKNFNYLINQNGPYAFTVLGKDGVSQDSVLVNVDTIDNVTPTITFKYDNNDMSNVEINVIDSESGFDKLITPSGETITGLPYTFDGTATQGTFTAFDKAGNRATKDFMLSSISIGGSATHTFVGVDGIPNEWTNKAARLRVGAQNTVDGVNSITINKTEGFMGGGLGDKTTPEAIGFGGPIMMFGGAPSLDTLLEEAVADSNGEYDYTITTPTGTHSDSIVIDKIDMVAPEITVIVDGNTVNYSVTDDVSGIKYIHMPNGEIKEIGTDMQLLVEDSFVLDGVGTFSLTVEDYAGNITTKEFDVNTTDTDTDTEEPDTETPDTETPDTETPDTPDTEEPDTEEPDTETDTSIPSTPVRPSRPSNNGSSNGSSSSNTSDKVMATDAEVKSLISNIPYTLPVGTFDLSSLKGYNKSDFDKHVLDIAKDRQTLKFKYKNRDIELIVEGVKLDTSNNTYKDVSSRHWAKNTITEATDRGFFAGVGLNEFKPKGILNYADAFTAINRVLMVNDELDMTNTRSDVEALTKSETDNHWSYYNFHSILSKLPMSSVGEIAVDGKLDYQQNMTRGALANTLYDLLGDMGLAQNKSLIVYRDMAKPSEAIQFAGNTGLMIGDNKNKFNVNDTLTRAELASVIVRLDHLLNK